MRRLKTRETLDTKKATKLLTDAGLNATVRVWHSGQFRHWHLPEPIKLDNGKLYVPKAELERWLVKRGLAEYTEL